MDDCIFCKIVKGELPSTKIHEDSDFLAFMNIYPAQKGHALIIPKNHIAWMQDADDATVSSIFVLAKDLMKKIKEGLACDYVQVTVMGEEVQHFHVHLIPRYFNHKLPNWTPVAYDSADEIQTYAAKIKHD